VTPFVGGALGIECRQRLLGLLRSWLRQDASPAPTVPSRSSLLRAARLRLLMLVALGGLGLGLEMLEARAQFAADVAEALQVLLGMADALLGLPAPPCSGRPRRPLP
jgi:hypothetical protein